jgi:phosphatidylserine decarboxylase
VHVNRSPIAGTITKVRYQKGKFGNAMANASSEANEQNVITLQGQGQTLVLRQIAGLLARRLVFTKSVGDQVARGERIGMMKFGSRMDVIMDPSVALQVKLGDRVKGGVTVLATSRPPATGELVIATEQRRQKNSSPCRPKCRCVARPTSRVAGECARACISCRPCSRA